MSLSVEEIANRYLPKHTIKSITPLGNGLINDTYLISGELDFETKSLVLQKVNSAVYPSPEIVIQNHLALNSASHKKLDSEQIISTLHPTVEGKYFIQDGSNFWRAQSYIKNSISYDEVLDEKIAFEGAKIVGKFNSQFTSLEPISIQEPIVGFHNLENYLAELGEALSTIGKLQNCKTEIEFINKSKSEMLSIFKSSQSLPQRICHYDTKINNILFDKKTNLAIKIIDLDNVMYGRVIFDFGDMMRTFISLTDENEIDLSLIKIRWDIVNAIAKGYLSETRNILSADEKSMLVSGGILITYEQAVRFFTDYLTSDKYYKTNYTAHNLDRVKNQVCLVKLFIENKERLESIIKYS